jgi:hypothetical protein
LRSLLGDRYINSEPHSIHVNLKLFLDLVFPCERGLENQLKRVWMTNSVHCTFEGEAKMSDRKRCANANLFRQIELFSNPVVVFRRVQTATNIIRFTICLSLHTGGQMSLFFKAFSQGQGVC